MSRLSRADKTVPELPTNPSVSASPVSAAVSGRLRTKLRTNCEIQYTVAQTHLNKWVAFLASKEKQVLSFTENFRDTDPTGSLKFEANAGKLTLTRDGDFVKEWSDYTSAHDFMKLGASALPNPVFPLTETTYERTVAAIPVSESVLKEAISAQVTENICTAGLWALLKT